ncbi:MAG: outer membrane beta-barrel protein [Pseudorhodoplanes sp.]|uniref:outer membrane beta-barrel protein n=1 Tax=Pseudorhodoplanes sp. TaxID=1934341 RepID=UPI003D105B25
MSTHPVRIFAIASLASVALLGAAHAQTSDDAIRRLEAKIDALAKENASLRSRLTKVEAAPRAARPQQEQGYIGPIGNVSTGPTPQQVNAAREAYAADMAVKYAAPAPVIPSYNWTGFYVGGHVGYGWGETGATPTGIVGLLVDPFTTDNDSWFAGVTFGYNYQAGRIVLGFEGEWSWSDISGSSNTNFLFGLVPGATVTGTYQNNWMFTSATRLGVAFDTLLIYGKAGVAWANNDYSVSASIPVIGFNYASTVSETEIGWLIGGGIEWAFAGNWTMKVEGTYADFGQKNRTFDGIPIAGLLTLPVNADIESHISTVKFGINYRFGDFGKTPVVARY